MSTGFGKARNPSYAMSDIVTIKRDIKLLYSLNRANSSPSQTVVPFITGVHNASAPSGYQGLNVAGGSMLGPIAFPHVGKLISASTLDVSKQYGAFTSFVEIGENGVANLDTISGAANDGQLLFIWYGGTSVITIRDVTSSGSGNILNFNSANYTLNNGDMLAYVFLGFPFNLWQQLTGGANGSGISGANKTLSNLTAPTAVNVDLQPQTDNGESLGSTNRWNFVRAYNFSMGNPNYAIFKLSGIDFTLLGYSALSPPFTCGDTIVKGLLQIKNSAGATPLQISTGIASPVTYACTDGHFFTGTGGLARFGIGAPNIFYVGLTYPVVIKTNTSYVVDSTNGAGTDVVIKMTDNTFARNCQLPDATAINVGRFIMVKNMGSHDVNMTTTAGQTVDGLASGAYILTGGTKRGAIFASDGSNWFVFGTA